MFNEKIKELMNSKNISQRDLAKAIKINESALSRYISGERKPRIDILANIARYFNVSIDELISDSSINTNFLEIRTIISRNASTLSNDEIKELLNILSDNIKSI